MNNRMDILRDSVRSLVLQVLRSPNTKWTLQGFGMLRAHLPNEGRLHVWSTQHAVFNVSALHDHPWEFGSLIVSGRIKNTRYAVDARNPQVVEARPCAWRPAIERTITPGMGLRSHDERPVWLKAYPSEYYHAGDTYWQAPSEVHHSQPNNGTVTVISRVRQGPDLARTYYEQGTEWVSAEPRRATSEEIKDIVGTALELWCK